MHISTSPGVTKRDLGGRLNVIKQGHPAAPQGKSLSPPQNWFDQEDYARGSVVIPMNRDLNALMTLSFVKLESIVKRTDLCHKHL